MSNILLGYIFDLSLFYQLTLPVVLSDCADHVSKVQPQSEVNKSHPCDLGSLQLVVDIDVTSLSALISSVFTRLFINTSLNTLLNSQMTQIRQTRLSLTRVLAYQSSGHTHTSGAHTRHPSQNKRPSCRRIKPALDHQTKEQIPSEEIAQLVNVQEPQNEAENKPPPKRAQISIVPDSSSTPSNALTIIRSPHTANMPRM